MKILSSLASFISKTFQFSMSQILYQKFIVSENLTYKSQPLLRLLFRFLRYRLCHIDKRQTKISENSTVSFLKTSTKQVFLESFKFFDPPTTIWLSFKFYAKLNGNHILMTNFSKLRKYQTSGLIELCNLSTGYLADRIFKLWKSCVYDYQVVKLTFFEILTF